MGSAIKWSENKLGSIVADIRSSRKKSFFAGTAVYTVFFSLYCCLTLLPCFLASGTFMGGDSIAQYYPMLVAFRRSLSDFFSGLASGAPNMQMMDLNYSFGSDMTTCTSYCFIPFLPYYIFAPLVPESGLPLFYGIGVVLLSYISGISFLCMCSYFEKDTLTAGFFAPFYVLCGNFYFIAAFNHHFMYMFIAFPLMIVGIDRIIRQKGFLTFVLSVSWLSLAGTGFLIYTIPFVVLFAAIRLWYVYRERYFANLAKYFVRGAGAFILALCISGILVLPSINILFSGSRFSHGTAGFSLDMLIPAIRYANWTLMTSTSGEETGVCAAVIPFLLYTAVCRKRSSEMKCYMLVMLLLICLPVIRLGLNGFNYAECRWGFVPSALLCFMCVPDKDGGTIPDKKNVTAFAVLSVVFVFLAVMNEKTAATVIVMLAALITALPFTVRALEYVSEKLRERLAANENLRQIFKYAVITVVSVTVIVCVFLLFTFKKDIQVSLIIACLAAALAAVLIYFRKDLRAVTGALLAIALTVSSVLYYINPGLNLYIPSELPAKSADTLATIAKLSADDDTFGRIYALHGTDEKSTEYLPGAYTNPDPFINNSLRFDIPDIYVFSSLISSDIMDLLSRCGQDGKSIMSIVNINGFSGKEALYSLFGVRYVYDIPETYEKIYGLEKYEGSDNNGTDLYINRYALPIGVTYSDTMTKERFESFNMAELPYAMMNEVYLEGAANSSGTVSSDKTYSHICDIELEKVSRGTVNDSIECCDNKITINEDVSGCFLYLCFEDVNASNAKGFTMLPYEIKTDDGTIYDTSVHNLNSTWNWKYANDRYCVTLGACENNIRTLEFISPFDYGKVYVAAVPTSLFTGSYDKLTAEKATNIKLLTNAIECDVDISSDKVLCFNMLYSNGWKAFVDGKPVPAYKANGVFIGLPLEAGAHTVRLEYTTPWLIEGAVLSVCSIAVLIVFVVVIKRRTGSGKTAAEKKGTEVRDR